MFNSILGLLKCIIDFALLCWLANIFFIFKNNRAKAIILIGVASAILYIVNLLHNPLINSATTLVCNALILLSLYEGHVWQLIACSAAALTIGIACEFIPIALGALFLEMPLSETMQETITNELFNLLGTAFFCLIVLLLKTIVQKIYAKKGAVKFTTSYAIICLPIVSIIFLYYMLYVSQYIEYSDELLGYTLIVYSSLVLVNVAIIVGENNQKKKYLLQTENNELKSKEKLNDLLIEMQDRHLKKMFSLAHDFQRELNGIEELAKRNSELIKRPVQEIRESLQDIDPYYNVKPLALQAILHRVNDVCAEQNINFETDIRFGDFGFMSFPDLYAFFDNAFENALEACFEDEINADKYIKVSIRRLNHTIFVEISNSHTRKPIEKNKILQTSKEDSVYHGYGLINIKKAVNRYKGTMSTKYDSGRFVLSVTLPYALIQ